MQSISLVLIYLLDILFGQESTQKSGTTSLKTKPNGTAASTSSVLSATSVETSAERRGKDSDVGSTTATATSPRAASPVQCTLDPSTTSLQQSGPQQSNIVRSLRLRSLAPGQLEPGQGALRRYRRLRPGRRTAARMAARAPVVVVTCKFNESRIRNVAQTTTRVRHPKPARRGVRSGLSSRRPHDGPRRSKTARARPVHKFVHRTRGVRDRRSSPRFRTTWCISSTPRTTPKTRA